CAVLPASAIASAVFAVVLPAAVFLAVAIGLSLIGSGATQNCAAQHEAHIVDLVQCSKTVYVTNYFNLLQNQEVSRISVSAEA
ncbi:MAG TPA: hypothetical protein PLV61_10060, partial [Parvularculaceae bacterium]|nr:hypothetical protein [Parvularculaceae bacterium]